GFKNSIPEDEMMCVVIDCGGTARIGVYPMKGIPTVDVMDASPSGPLAKHITEDIFVSGVGAKDVMKGDADADTAKETASAAKLENPTFDTNDKEGYKPVFVQKGSGGWGKGLHLEPSNKKTKVVSVTGGGIHPVAQKISELSGAEAVDGFKNSISEDEMMYVVIECGGTARIGVYPMKGIPTVDVMDASPSGPLAKHITEDVFVSGVGAKDVMNGDADADTAEETASAAKQQNPKFDKNGKYGNKQLHAKKGSGGWGEGLRLEPRTDETKVVSARRGGKHELASTQ